MALHLSRIALIRLISTIGATDSAHVATKIMGILPLSDSADARAILRECFRQLNCDLDETDPRKTVYQAFDAVERTHVTVVVPPTGLERDLFFALELAKAVDVLIFAVNSNAEMIDEVCCLLSELNVDAPHDILVVLLDRSERAQRLEGCGLPRRSLLRGCGELVHGHGPRSSAEECWQRGGAKGGAPAARRALCAA